MKKRASEIWLNGFLRKVYAFAQYSKHWLSKKNSRRSLYLITILISLGFISFVIYRNLNQFQTYAWKLDPWYLLIALVSFGPAMLATIIAWHYLLKALGVHIQLKNNITIYSLSALPRHIPGLVLYLTNRALLYEEFGISPFVILSASALEILFFALTGFSTSLGFLIASPSETVFDNLFKWLGGVSVLLLLLIFLLNRFLHWILCKLLRQDPAKLPQVGRRWLLFSLFWMCLAWGGGGVVLFFSARAIIRLEPYQILQMISVWGVSGATSMTVGALTQGFGIRELAMGGLLSLFLPPVFAAVIAVGFRLVFTLAELFWVFIFLGLTKLLPKLLSSSPGN